MKFSFLAIILFSSGFTVNSYSGFTILSRIIFDMCKNKSKILSKFYSIYRFFQITVALGAITAPKKKGFITLTFHNFLKK